MKIFRISLANLPMAFLETLPEACCDVYVLPNHDLAYSFVPQRNTLLECITQILDKIFDVRLPVATPYVLR